MNVWNNLADKSKVQLCRHKRNPTKILIFNSLRWNQKQRSISKIPQNCNNQTKRLTKDQSLKRKSFCKKRSYPKTFYLRVKLKSQCGSLVLNSAHRSWLKSSLKRMKATTNLSSLTSLITMTLALLECN